MTDGNGSATPTIAVKGLWKVFGPAEHRSSARLTPT